MKEKERKLRIQLAEKVIHYFYLEYQVGQNFVCVTIIIKVWN